MTQLALKHAKCGLSIPGGYNNNKKKKKDDNSNDNIVHYNIIIIIIEWWWNVNFDKYRSANRTHFASV